MKTFTLFVIGIWLGMVLSAQEQGPLPKISQQMSDYFGRFPREKVFVTTDKFLYKPGETIWFRAFAATANNFVSPVEHDQLFVKLYDAKGVSLSNDVFRLEKGTAIGDLQVPETLGKGYYSLVAYTLAHNSPEEISITVLKIDPQYSSQLVSVAKLNDSISTCGNSNSLSVELRDIQGNPQKNTNLKYQVMNGDEVVEKGKVKTDDTGKVTLPFTLPAKTNGEPFVCLISDGKEEWNRKILLPSNLDPVILSFFPEGGSLVTGIPSKVGFTAFSKWGLPLDVEGMVTDQEGKQVSLVKTFTKGLGLFSVPNAKDQKYKLVLSGKNGQNQSFELPASKPDGLALSVVKSEAGFITTNLIFGDKQSHTVALLVNQGSSIYWASDIEINGMGRVKIPVENLPHGINQLSVFSSNGQLLAQRIVFTDKKQEMKIAVIPDRNQLKSGESMKVKVSLTDENGLPLSGNVSIAVSDKFRMNAINHGIAEHLLVGAELAYPFSMISDALKDKPFSSALMDMYLISNRLKAFDWAKINQFVPGNATETNSGAGGISGSVTDKAGIKINKAKVTLVNNKNMQLHTTTSNADGRFSFPNLNAGTTDDFSAKATDPDGKRELNITFSKNLDDRISDFVANVVLKYNFYENENSITEDYFHNNPDLFQKQQKPVKSSSVTNASQQKLLSTASSLLDVIKTMKAYTIRNNQVVFAGTDKSINFQGGALIVLDGQQLGTDISAIQNIAPIDVDHIYVSTNPMDIQRYTGLNSVGLIEIFLKKPKLPEPALQGNSKENKYSGIFRIPGDFRAEQTDKKNPLGTTLQWISEQKVDESGRFDFSVTAGRVISDFVIEVQGISGNGRMGCGHAVFSVIK